MQGKLLKGNGPNFGDLDFVFVYLDDILISSGTEEEHCGHFQAVFKRLSKAGLAINLPKSEFFFLQTRVSRTRHQLRRHQALAKAHGSSTRLSCPMLKGRYLQVPGTFLPYSSSR